MERRALAAGGLVTLAILAAAGCITSKLYAPAKYDETALSFYVTEDGSRLVVLGQKYHYILDDMSPSLKQVLLAPLELRTAVVAHLSNFSVNGDNVVTGDYKLSLQDTATEVQRRKAIGAGFVEPELTLSGKLKGQRYSAEGFRLPENTQKFLRPYVVSVEESRSLTTKVLLTPLTITADGMLILAGTALVVFLAAAPGGGPMPGITR